jgi:hypothetical protein
VGTLLRSATSIEDPWRPPAETKVVAPSDPNSANCSAIHGNSSFSSSRSGRATNHGCCRDRAHGSGSQPAIGSVEAGENDATAATSSGCSSASRSTSAAL